MSYSCQNVTKLIFSVHIFQKFSNTKFNQNPFIESLGVPCRWTDRGRQRDRRDAANSSFFSRNFANMPQMSGVTPPLQHMPSWRTHGFHEHWRLPNSIKVCYARSMKFLVITWAVSRWSLVWKEPRRDETVLCIRLSVPTISRDLTWCVKCV